MQEGMFCGGAWLRLHLGSERNGRAKLEDARSSSMNGEAGILTLGFSRSHNWLGCLALSSGPKTALGF